MEKKNANPISISFRKFLYGPSSTPFKLDTIFLNK